MAQINFARREIACKLVYYGPGLGGKTTNLETIYKKAPDNIKGKLTSIATESDRTLFFDFTSLELGEVQGMKIKLQLYTVPGQVYYNSTRKIVLQGADGVIMVYDSSPDRMSDNLESLENLGENLKENGLDIKKIPFVIQYNKRDIPGAMKIEDMRQKLNPFNVPEFESVATTGVGVMETLRALSKMVLENIQKGVSQRQPKAIPVARVEKVPVSLDMETRNQKKMPPLVAATTISVNKIEKFRETPPKVATTSLPKISSTKRFIQNPRTKDKNEKNKMPSYSAIGLILLILIILFIIFLILQK